MVAIYEVPYPNLDSTLPPFIPAEHNLRSTSDIISHFQDLGPVHEQPAPLDYITLGLTPPIASILNSVQHVSQLVPKHDSYPTASTSLVILTRLCTLLSHILSLPPITESSLAWAGIAVSNSHHSALVSESTRYAILLHVFTPWKGLPPDGTLSVNHLVHQLMGTLRSLFLSSYDRSNALVLWSVAAGGVAALGSPERRWFVSHLADMTDEMGIETWEEMKANVSRGIWHETLCARRHRMLWDEVSVQKGGGE